MARKVDPPRLGPEIAALVSVRHRLRRIEQLTGRSLSSPRAAAELCLALEGVRLLPAVGGGTATRPE